MGNTSDAKKANLRLLFNGVGEDPAFDGGGPSYEVKLVDATGEGIMQLRLPRRLVKSAVVQYARPIILMAPDGALSVEFDGIEDAIPSAKSLAIDHVIERSVTPAMLEDEPDAGRMLQILRGRLQHAVGVIDAALARLR